MMSEDGPSHSQSMTFEEKIEKSSQVCFVDYNEFKRELSVVFRTNATLYVYFEYPPEMWDELRAAPSIGSFLHHRVTRRGTSDGALPYRYEKRKLPDGFVMPVPKNTHSAKTNSDMKAPNDKIGF